MNKIKLIVASAVALFSVFSCVEPEALNLQPENKYTEAYYEALRAYKASDHSICYIWLADYGVPTSPAYRFAGVPDSVDVISLWGGCPKKGTLDWQEMQELRIKKGTKMVGVHICRLAHTGYLPTWPKEAGIPTYFEGYNGQKGYNDTYQETYDAEIASGKDEAAAKAAAESAAHKAGTRALISDMNANQSRTLKEGSTEENPEWVYPDWCVYAGKDIMRRVEEGDLDGFDLDFEPEGDALDGQKMVTFLQWLSQYLGPKSGTGKLLIVDGMMPDAAAAELLDYHVSQNYGRGISDYNFNKPGWKNSQLIFTENIGDEWSTGGNMEQMAAFQPSTGGRKGGFGSFHGQRDYNTTDSGANNVVAYGHTRRAIQLQNPAVLK